MMWRHFLISLALLLAMTAVAKADIYRWRDSGGLLHVTNDPSKVPPEKLESARVRSLRDLNVAGGSSSAGGSGLFESKCGACHLAGMESTGDGEGGDGKLALLPFLIDSESGLPMSKDEVLELLSSAVQGRFSDMPAIEIASEDLEKIAGYLLGKLR